MFVVRHTIESTIRVICVDTVLVMMTGYRRPGVVNGAKLVITPPFSGVHKGVKSASNFFESFSGTRRLIFVWVIFASQTKDTYRPESKLFTFCTLV